MYDFKEFSLYHDSAVESSVASLKVVMQSFK